MRSIISTIAGLALALPTTLAPGSIGTIAAVTFPAALLTMSGEPAEARGGGGRGGGGRAGRGGGGGQSIGHARHTGSQSINHNVNRNVNRDVDKNVNVNRNVNVDVNHRYDHGYGAGLATGLVIGAVVSSIPNYSSCVVQTYGGVAYQHCDGVWYQPQYSGSNVTYIVVNNPG